MNFGSLMTAMITPFDKELNIDYEQAGRLARYLVQNSTESIILAGTTGESPTLTEAEKEQLFLVVKEAVGNDAKIIMGAGSNDTAGTVKAVKKAESMGADGVMLVVPYYNKPSQEGLYEHFKEAAGSSDLPVILYNIPGRCSCNMLPETVCRLAEIRQIKAIKEASGSLDQIMAIRQYAADDFLIYSGDDSMTLPILSVGGSGIISVASHLAGPVIAKMIKAWQQGDTALAADLNTRLYPLFKALFIAPNPAPLKYALGQYGFDTNHLRLPLVPLNADEQAMVDKAVNQFKRVTKSVG